MTDPPPLDHRVRAARRMNDDLRATRRELHRYPEVGLALPQTQRVVLRELERLPMEVSTGRASTSVVALLRGTRSGPTVLLRADMDALPIQEETGLPYSSAVPGVMHACGHDLHVAMLIGAARLLAKSQRNLAGNVVFMFQPGEEGFGGALSMLDEGVLDVAPTPVEAAYGIHVSTNLFDTGVFASRAGTIMASADGVTVRVRGAGGHGSMPHHARDPLAPAADMVSALSSLTSREFDIFDPVVVNVGSFHAGSQRNVIPVDAVFEVTVRSFSRESRARILRRIEEVCRGIASAHRIDVEVVVAAEDGPTINDPECFRHVRDCVGELFGPERFQEMATPFAGAEDFSAVLEKVPGAFVMLGAGGTAGADAAPNHSPLALFDDGVLADGAALLAHLASRHTGALEENRTAQNQETQ